MKGFWKNYLTDEELKIILFIVIFALIGIGVKYTSLIAEDQSNEFDELDISRDHEIKYDLHTVTAKELTTIPGIGTKRAADIISYREEKGFSSKAELKSVKGIGTATYNKIAGYFNDFGLLETIDFQESTLQPEIIEDDSNDKGYKININTATVGELIKLKGIGKTKAEAIVQYRNINKEFLKVDELVKVKGIGKKTLDKIKDRICIGEDE